MSNEIDKIENLVKLVKKYNLGFREDNILEKSNESESSYELNNNKNLSDDEKSNDLDENNYNNFLKSLNKFSVTKKKYVDNFGDLLTENNKKHFILIDYINNNDGKEKIDFLTDAKECKKNKCYYKDILVFSIKLNDSEKLEFNDTEKILKLEIKLYNNYIKRYTKNKKVFFRFSGNYIKKSRINNSTVIMMSDRVKILNLRKKFNPTDNENYIGILHIPFDDIFINNPNETIINNFINDIEYMKYKDYKFIFKHHLKISVDNINIWKHIRKKYNIPYILILIQKSLISNKILFDLPGGKREFPNEKSWECAVRETNEETGFNCIKIKDYKNTSLLKVINMNIYIVNL